MFKFAISGKANSGKNTVASLIVDKMNLSNDKYKIVALADPIKRLILEMFPDASADKLFGASEKRKSIISDFYKDQENKSLTHRQALLDLGKFGRQYNMNFWLRIMINDLEKSKNITTYIVSDCRFINEFQYLQENNFTMIRILRDNCSNIDDPSEKEQDSIPNAAFDFIIENNTSLENLSAQVDSMLAKITYC